MERRVEPEQGDVVVVSIPVKLWVHDNFFNSFARADAHLAQAHIARLYFPYFSKGEPAMRSSSQRIGHLFSESLQNSEKNEQDNRDGIIESI